MSECRGNLIGEGVERPAIASLPPRGETPIRAAVRAGARAAYRGSDRRAYSSDPPILQIVGDGAAGGGTTVVLQLARALADRGARVTVASQAGSYILGQARHDGLTTLPLDFSSRLNTFTLARRIARYLHDQPGTLVHAHGARAMLSLAMLPASYRSALIYTVHGFHFWKKPPGLRQLAMLAERVCAQRATAVVFVAANDATVAASRRLVPRGATTRLIHNGAMPAQARAHPAAADVAFLGRLHVQKNPAILADILASLRPLRPTLSVIGGGDLEAMLRDRVRQFGLDEQVTFHGEQSHADALRLLETARIMVLPSRWEGLPVSVLEAMHRGIPVIASDVPGTRELVIDGETGFLVPGDQPSAYAERIGRLLRDDGLYGAMRRRAIAVARERFSVHSQLEAHLRLYADAAGFRRGADA